MGLDWIDAIDSVPVKDGFYLICLWGHDISTFAFYDACVDDWFKHPWGGAENLVNVTYWMPFPTSPEGNGFDSCPRI